MRVDRGRQRVGDRRFALGVQIIEGRRDPLAVAVDYARIAEAALVTLADATIREFETQHGRVPGSELAILALGRLGGGAPTQASDLELIYLFTGEFTGESDGRKIGRAHVRTPVTNAPVVFLILPAKSQLLELDNKYDPQ